MSAPQHAVRRSFATRLVPFGVGHTKPKHFRNMLGILWRNRDNLP